MISGLILWMSLFVDLELLPLHNLQGDTDTAGPVNFEGRGFALFAHPFSISHSLSHWLNEK